MKINVFNLKEKNNYLSDFMDENIYNYLLDLTEENIEDFKKTLKYNTLDSLGFLKEKNNKIYPDIKIIKEYDMDIYDKFISYLFIKFIYKQPDILASNENEWNINDFENMSEDVVMEQLDNQKDDDYLLYDSYYSKLLENAGFLNIKNKKVKIVFKNEDLNKNYYKDFLENSISLVSSNGLDFNKPVTNYLKEIEILTP